MNSFPQDFTFGVSTSAYQIEGAWDIDGKGMSNWDVFVHTPGKIKGGCTGDVACDHYHRYQEDVALMSEAGLDAYRFSISWPRVMPEGRGRLNGKGLDFYDKLVDALLDAGIDPWVCLFHWDLPQALQECGGWLNRDCSQWYADYAANVMTRLSDRVRHVLLFNEASDVVNVGYVLGLHPPEIKNLQQGLRVLHHFNLATGITLQALRTLSNKFQIGTTLPVNHIVPASGSPEDEEAANLVAELRAWAFWDPVLTGTYSDFAASLLGGLVTEDDLANIHQGLDFLGVNHYCRSVVCQGRGGKLVDYVRGASKNLPVTKMGWEIYPQGIRNSLHEVRKRYGDLPIFITENGGAFPDTDVCDGRIEDRDRIAYFSAYLSECARAIEEGVNLQGYFVWSLLDNFEWTHGYEPRFGIVHVDYDTLERTPKASYHWYSALCRTRSLPAI